jgi:general secretion pathway protein G
VFSDDAKNMKKSVIGLWVAVMIIVLAAMLVPGSHRSPDAQIKCAYADVNGGLKTVLQIFKEDCGRLPTTEDGLKVLCQHPTNDLAKGWRGPYFDQVPIDPWGHDYVYRCPGIHNTNGYDLYSLGRDGKSKTGGNDPDDICNLEKPVHAAPATAQAYKVNLFDGARESIAFIPIFFVFRVIAGLTSRRFRSADPEERLADWVCFAIAIFALMVFFMPRISG